MVHLMIKLMSLTLKFWRLNVVAYYFIPYVHWSM